MTSSPTPTRLPQWAEDKIARLQYEKRTLQEECHRLTGLLMKVTSIAQEGFIRDDPASAPCDTDTLNRDLQAFTSADIYRAAPITDGEGETK